MKKVYFYLLISCFLLSACTNNVNNKLIIGTWKGVEWVGNTVILDGKKASFTFDDNGDYNFIYDGNKEDGTYKVENDMLFTKPANQQEIMVKIVKLTKDSLTFNMNRSGQSETLILIR
jgi:hypothetical protein